MNPILGLAVGRILIGLVSLVSPTLAGRLFLLDPERNPQMEYISRLFGSREIALGAAALATSGSSLRNVVVAGVAIDAADAAASALAGRSGVIGKVPSAALTGVALSAVATGAIALATRKA